MYSYLFKLLLTVCDTFIYANFIFYFHLKITWIFRNVVTF